MSSTWNDKQILKLRILNSWKLLASIHIFQEMTTKQTIKWGCLLDSDLESVDKISIT